MTDEECLRAVQARHRIRNLPLNLEAELTRSINDVGVIRRIVTEAERLVYTACPESRALEPGFVTWTAGARVAWDTAIDEGAKIGPRALAAVLLRARTSTEMQLPLVESALVIVLAARTDQA